MNVSNNNIIKPKAGRLKKSQRGMTLVEVLVSMFVLAVGVLALLATQLRTVASVQEAESQTVVAQAVQNLMESMLINPTLCSKDDKDDSRCAEKVKNTPEDWVVKSYDNEKFTVDDSNKRISYKFSDPIKVRDCSKSKWCRPDDSKSLNKREILEDHLARFENSVFRALPNANAWYIICNDNSGNDMTISGGNVNHRCSKGANDPLVVKVLWEMEVEKIKDNKALTQNNTKIVYTYQARFAE